MSQGGGGGRSANVMACVEWLVGRLSDGPVESKTIDDEAGALGYGPGTLKSAKKKLPLVSKPGGFGGGWTLALAVQGDPTGAPF